MNDDRSSPDRAMARYAPVTVSIAFLEAPFEKARNAALEWYSGIGERSGLDWPVSIEACDGSFEDKMRALLPLVSRWEVKWLLTETADPRWCAWFGNQGIRESDVRSGSGNIGDLLRTRVVDIVAAHDVPGKEPGSVQFEWADRSTEPPKFRSVASHRESRWEFHQFGDPLPFEELDAYSERRIKDRLTFERLDRYCRHLGIHPFEPAFYVGRGAIIRTPPLPNTAYIDRFPNAPDLLPLKFD